MAEYRLHGFAQSGNAYKVALMLDLVGADWEPVFLDFFNGAHRAPEFLKLNPMGEAPVLEGPDGVQTQSGAILHALARRFGAFGGETDAERDEILRWILWDNHKLTGYAATYRFLTNFLPEAKRDAGAIGFLGGRMKAAFKILEARLAEQDFLATPDRPTIADLSACGYLFWLDELGLDPADLPRTAAWLDRIRSLPGWRHPYETLPGHPLPAREG
ncbi:MAG: glutathione S-transferase [Pseudomonadota bacterium]